MTNPYIAQRRQQFAAEVADPSVHDEVCAMMITEDGTHPVPCLESLFNRTDYVKSAGHTQTIRGMLHSGFYGPYNRGMYPRTIARLHADPHLQARMEAAIATVFAGSNLIQGFTDQGLPTDPNGRRLPHLVIGGNVFNDWGGGPGGHDGAETWRQAFEAAKHEAPTQPPPSGLHTTENLQVALNHFGYTPPLAIDGQYEPTIPAIKWFQVRHSLKPDGIPGPLTWAAIDAELANPQLTVENDRAD
jgi:hypothetical protein